MVLHRRRARRSLAVRLGRKEGGTPGRNTSGQACGERSLRRAHGFIASLIAVLPAAVALGASGPAVITSQLQGQTVLQTFQITEFMAANDHSLHDEDGDSSDWLEIHNPGNAVEFLDGWYLTDDPSHLTKWRFPAGVEMSAKGYRVVFASGKDRTNAVRLLHTNFKLAAEGEYLALVDPMTNVVSAFAPAYPAQRAD